MEGWKKGEFDSWEKMLIDQKVCQALFARLSGIGQVSSSMQKQKLDIIYSWVFRKNRIIENSEPSSPRPNLTSLNNFEYWGAAE